MKVILMFLVFYIGCRDPDLDSYNSMVNNISNEPLRLLINFNVHFLGGRIVVRTQDNKHQFYAAFKQINDSLDLYDMRLVGVDSLGFNSDEKIKLISTARLACKIMKRWKIEKIYTDITGDSSLVFVLSDTYRLQVFLGDRPSSFPYDKSAQDRFKINSCWDLLRLKKHI